MRVAAGEAEQTVAGLFHASEHLHGAGDSGDALGGSGEMAVGVDLIAGRARVVRGIERNGNVVEVGIHGDQFDARAKVQSLCHLHFLLTAKRGIEYCFRK